MKLKDLYPYIGEWFALYTNTDKWLADCTCKKDITEWLNNEVVSIISDSDTLFSLIVYIKEKI